MTNIFSPFRELNAYCCLIPWYLYAICYFDACHEPFSRYVCTHVHVYVAWKSLSSALHSDPSASGASYPCTLVRNSSLCPPKPPQLWFLSPVLQETADAA